MKETLEYVVHPKIRVTSTKQTHIATFIIIKGYTMHNMVAMLSFPFSHGLHSYKICYRNERQITRTNEKINFIQCTDI